MASSMAAAFALLLMFLLFNAFKMDDDDDDNAESYLRRLALAIDQPSIAREMLDVDQLRSTARRSAWHEQNSVGTDDSSFLEEVQCESRAYPPKPSRKIEERIVNLDLPPYERWHDLSVEYADEMKTLLYAIRNLTHPIFHGLLFDLVDRFAPKLVDTLPYPFPDELKGIANASGIALGEVALFNIFYEIFTVCTSIVGQTPAGQVFHGRNLDFGLFLGWDERNHTWVTTEILRRMTVQIDAQSGGHTVFTATTFVGYVGVLTGMKPGAFSLTVDERFKFIGGYVGIIEWLLGRRSGNWMGFLTRSVLENSTMDYEEAQRTLARAELLAPVYFIVGGNRTGQASVITRGLKFVDVWDLSQSKSDAWYLVQTNYDHWKKPPFYDDRRTPAKKCLDRLGEGNFTFAELFNVLSTKPVRNKLTAYTTLMDVQTDTVESYLQYCTDPDCPNF